MTARPRSSSLGSDARSQRSIPRRRAAPEPKEGRRWTGRARCPTAFRWQCFGRGAIIDRDSVFFLRANLSGLARPSPRMGQGFDIYGDREYFPCGCSFVVDPKTGETLRSFPCERHKYLEADQSRGPLGVRREVAHDQDSQNGRREGQTGKGGYGGAHRTRRRAGP